MIYDANGKEIIPERQAAMRRTLASMSTTSLFRRYRIFPPTLYGPNGAVVSSIKIAPISEREYRIPFSRGGENA